MDRSFSADCADIPSLLHCSICLESYDSTVHQPKLLPCHHSFCKQCLINITTHGQIVCPTCRDRVTVMAPIPVGVSNLQTNFYINQMRDYLQLDTKAKGCRKHDNNSLTLFCQTCEVLICATCKSIDHKEAAGHEVQDLEAAKRDQVRILQVEMVTAQDKIIKYAMKKQDYETELTSLGITKAKALQNIDTSFDRYVDSLNQRRQELKEEVSEIFQQKRGTLWQSLENLKMVDTSLTSLVEQVKESISNGHISDLLAYRAKLTSKNREFSNDVDSAQEINPNYIKFNNEDSDIQFMDMVQSLGKITTKTHLPCKIKVNHANTVAGLYTNFTITVKDCNGDDLENYPIDLDITDIYDDVIPSMVQYRSRSQYEVTFRPEVSGLHRIQIKFLDQVIRGSSGLALEVRSNDPVSKLGGKDDVDIEMEFPRSVTVDRQNHLYVVDTGNNRIQRFDKSGRYLTELPISSESEMYSSCGLAVNEIQGTLICPEVCVQEADLSEASAILVFSLEGELLHRYVYNDIMRRALSVAVNDMSNMIIADYELNTVFIFDKSGRLLRKFGETGSGPGQFHHPTFLCVGDNNSIIVSDGNNHRIQVFDRNGKFLYQFGGYGAGKGQFNMPFGVAADYHGNILVVDGGNRRIQIFKQGGEFIACIESLGDKLNAPRGIAVTSDGYVIVADRDNHCIKKYKYLHCTSL